MIRIALEADTAAELRQAIQDLAGIRPQSDHASFGVGGSQRPADTFDPYPQVLLSRMGNLLPDEPSPCLELRTGSMRAEGGFAVCWHKALPHVRRLVKRTNIFFQCSSLRLLEKGDV